MASTRIRMYRPGGIGDCFLLSFEQGDKPAHVLIDCGVLFPTRGKADRLRAIMADIRQVTGDHLDVLVATHEHYDHLSGFEFAYEEVAKLQIEQVWVAWTEDPNDEEANELRRKHGEAFAGLVAAHRQLAPLAPDEAKNLEDLLGFSEGLGAGALGKRPRGTAQQLEYVKGLADQPAFLEPGTIVEVPRTDVKAYVLGPPRDLELLTRSNPSTRHSEVYGVALTGAQAFFGGAGMSAPLGVDYPFERNQGKPLADAEAELACYFDPQEAWRRIDAAWLGAASDLALKLDEDTNNTSLVLAFALGDGRVLLHPGDAQVGSWLSWDTLEFPDGVTSRDLLGRCVLYKVSHHGSHNGTLRELGLELMSNRDLVALLPVDEKQAAQQGAHGWKMPFPPLYERLGERTRHRILRSDTGLPGQRPDGAPKREWEAFTNSVKEDELYVEYEFVE